MASEYVSIWQSDLQVAYSFIVLKGKTYHTQGENCNELKHFPWGPWEGIVTAASA